METEGLVRKPSDCSPFFQYAHLEHIHLSLFPQTRPFPLPTLTSTSHAHSPIAIILLLQLRSPG